MISKREKFLRQRFHRNYLTIGDLPIKLSDINETMYPVDDVKSWPKETMLNVYIDKKGHLQIQKDS